MDFYKSVCEFYILVISLRMSIKKSHHEKTQETDSIIVISDNDQNQVLETCISMKFDAECNKTVPRI